MRHHHEELVRTEWHGGQLLAFSAVDGPTDYRGALTARTAFDAPGLNILLPDHARIRFPVTKRTETLIAGDVFVLAGDPPIQGVFIDTHHLLIEGPCEMSLIGLGITHLSRGHRTLIGSTPHFDPGKLTTDFSAALRHHATACPRPRRTARCGDRW